MDTLKAIDTYWDEYVKSEEAETVKDFYNTWAQYGMDAWADKLTHIAE